MPGGVGAGVCGVGPLRRGLLRGINGHAAGIEVAPVAAITSLPASWPLLPLRDGPGSASFV